MPGPSGQRSSYLRIALRMLVFDSQGALAACVLWLWLELAHPLTLVVLLIARVPAWLWLLRRALEPVLRWERTPESRADDELLLRADTELQHIPRRFAWHFSLTWLVSLLFVVLSSFTHVPASAPVLGGSEKLCLLLLFGAAILPAPAFYGAIVERLLAPLLEEISAELMTRGLTPRRAPSSLAATLARFTNSLLVAVLLLSSAIFVAHRGRQRRETTTTELRQLVELSVVLVDHDEAPLAGAELLPAQQLEPELAALLGSSSSFAAYVPTLGDSVALGRTRAGAVLRATRTPDEQLRYIAAALVLVFGVLLPFVWYATIDFARGVTGPLERFGGAARGFAEEGELRELERITPLRADEIGRLAARLNNLFDKLEELTLAAERVAQGDLRIELEQPGALHDAFAGMIQRLREMVGELRETSTELGTAAGGILALMHEQELAATRQAAAISEANLSIATLASSAGQIASATGSVVEDVVRAANMSEAVATKIGSLQAQTGDVSALLEQINEIAERSDLLALNGSLEAVRAGEVGRGFALVASEMRRLAERVANILDAAREQISEIESAGIDAVEVAARGRELAERAASAARSISTVTVEQDRQTRSAATGMGELGELTADTARLTTQTRDAAEGLQRHASRLETLLEAFHG